MTEQFSTFDKVHKEVDSKIVLEDIVHADYEWVLDIIKNVFLKLKAVEKVLVYYDIFSYCFHGINLLSFAILDKENFSESSFSNHFFDLEIL